MAVLDLLHALCLPSPPEMIDIGLYSLGTE